MNQQSSGRAGYPITARMAVEGGGLVGKFVATLTPEEEHRALTRVFEPVAGEIRTACGLPTTVAGPDALPVAPTHCRCLVMTAFDHHTWVRAVRGRPDAAAAGLVYEDLCGRFGIERVNRAIRNRILRNIARRQAGALETVGCA